MGCGGGKGVSDLKRQKGLNVRWFKQSLASIAEKITDGSHNPPKGVIESDYLMLSSKNVFDDNFHYDQPRYLTEAQFQQENKRTGIVQGDVLLTIVGTVGRCAVVPPNGPKITLQRSVAVIRPITKIILPRFLMYSFICRNEELNDQARGVAQKGIYLETLRDLLVIFPSLPEQQRIVALLDEAFAAIATAKANAEKNLKNARALFDSYLNAVFSRRGDGWVENKLVSLTSKIGSGATPRGGGESYKMEGTSLIRSLNVHDPGFRYSKLAFLDDGQADGLSNVIVQPGDVLLNITGASVARCCIVPDDVLPARVNQHVSIIRPIASKLDSDFLHYLLISKYYKDQLLQTGAEGGATRQAITKAQIQDFTVGYPEDRGEQQSIVSKLDALRKETQHLESIYQKKIEALDALKKSILYQAFTGEL